MNDTANTTRTQSLGRNHEKNSAMCKKYHMTQPLKAPSTQDFEALTFTVQEKLYEPPCKLSNVGNYPDSLHPSCFELKAEC